MMIESARYTEYGEFCVTIDGREMIVPDDTANSDRQMLAAWVADGNTIAPYEPPEPALDDYRSAIQAHVDATAQARNYDSAVSCASYVNSTNPQWAAEAQAFMSWRDAVWAYAFAELDKVQSGQREQPTVADFVAEVQTVLPMEWPE